MSPPPPPEVIEAAESLKYRDFLTVVLIVDQPETFPDNWIYIHEPDVRLGRVQNFKNWSPDLVPDPTKSSLGLEYFCFEGDDLWTMSDADLIALGRREIDAIGLVAAARGHRRLRRPDAQGLPGLRRRLPGPPGRRSAAGSRTLANLELAGRNGMHKYNNQDHSMMTAAPRRAEHPRPGPVRHLEGQHRRRVPRGRRRARPTEAGRAVPRRIDAA